jgi:hypothetical protein
MRTLRSLLRPTAALRHLGAQWAFVAMLAVALMPTVSRIVQESGPTGWATCQAAAPANSSGDPQDGASRHGDACALCSLAHTTPVLAGAAPAPVAVLAYAPPAPPADAPVRAGVPQARAPSARAPPRSA